VQITEDRRKRVIDLYFSQHKTYAEIAEIEHISPRDIYAIVKEEKDRRLQYQHQQQQEEISSKAYKLFSEGKKPVEVAIVLNLREPEATKYYREYWRLKRLDKLIFIFKETNGKLGPFLKIYRLIKEKGMTIDQVVNAVDIAIHKLPYMESLYEQLNEQVDNTQRTRQQSENYLHNLKEEIASSKELLKSYTNSCERKRQEAKTLNNDISRLETVISRFKSNNEEYLKIEKTVEQKVKSVLTDNKQILQFALASVIEAIRRNPDKYNNLLAINISSSIIPTQESLPLHNEDYKTMILEESDNLYNELIKELVNRIMSAVNPPKTSLSS
jgi:hypothetical protein